MYKYPIKFRIPIYPKKYQNKISKKSENGKNEVCIFGVYDFEMKTS